MRVNLVSKKSDAPDGRQAMKEELGALLAQVESLQARLATADSAVSGLSTAAELLKDKAPELIDNAVEVVHNPPATWTVYESAHDCTGILRMEMRELVNAVRQADTMEDTMKELTHVIAAFLKCCK